MVTGQKNGLTEKNNNKHTERILNNFVIVKCLHKGIGAWGEVGRPPPRFHRNAQQSRSSKFGLLICYHHREKTISYHSETKNFSFGHRDADV